ncbi:MAG TPA: hypothetical protein VFJ58_29410 [Armatimonadota bacterium]|nr:hypothetical protein [Armatimonadota bacterium]
MGRIPRLLLVATLACGLLAACPPAMATYTLSVPSLPGGSGKPVPMPAYFSGTNSQASGSVTSDDSTDPPVVHFTLLVNDIVVRDHTYGPPDYYQASIWDWATFDSSHFADASTVTVKLKVWVEGNPDPLIETGAAPVYNKTYVLGNQTLTYGQTAADDVDARASSANWDPTESTSDTAATIIAGIPTYTGFYFYTHANAGVFGDCLYDPDTGAGAVVSAADVSGAVHNKTAAEPPYNLVFIDGCLSASDDSLSNAFGIGGTDTCFIGYTTEVDDSAHNTNWSNDLWSELAGGDKASDAISDATTDADGPPTDDGVDAVPGTFGDGSATVHGTAYGASKGNWFTPQP